MFFLGQNLSLLPHIFLLVTYVAGITTVSINIARFENDFINTNSCKDFSYKEEIKLNTEPQVIYLNHIQSKDDFIAHAFSVNNTPVKILLKEPDKTKYWIFFVCNGQSANHFKLFSRPPPFV